MTRSIKILCVIPYYYPAFQYGGPIASVHGLNKALVNKGVSVTVYTTNVGLGSKVPVNSDVILDGVRVVYFELTKIFGPVMADGWQFSIELAMALKKNISEFDVVYVNGLWNYPAAIACYYSRRYKKPYVVAPRGMLYSYTMAHKAWKKWPYYRLISKRDMQCASAIHYTTNDEAEQCHARLRLNGMKLTISNGVDVSSFEHLPKREKLRKKYPVLEDKIVFLFMSRISWKKGLDILIQAFEIASRNREDMHLLIVGPDEDGYEKKVKGWVEDASIEDKVSFTGMLIDDEKLEVLAGSDVFVLPSYSENFGMVVIEAMACSLPVVISDQVGICDDVGSAGAGVTVRTDAEQLANAMSGFMNNPDLCREMGKRGKELVVNKYGWDQITTSMIRSYEKIIISFNQKLKQRI